MRLVKWNEFKTLPSGTVFQEYELHILGRLSVLGGLMGDNDFMSAELLPACLTGDIYGGRVTDTFVISHPSGFGRDASYNVEERTWLVWETEDTPSQVAAR
jgi:hypothetical protein